MVAQNESDNEKGHSQENGNSSDQVNEVSNFLGNGRVAGFQTRCQACAKKARQKCSGEKIFKLVTSNTTHNSLVSNIDNHAASGTFDSICREECQISRTSENF